MVPWLGLGAEDQSTVHINVHTLRIQLHLPLLLLHVSCMFNLPLCAAILEGHQTCLGTPGLLPDCEAPKTRLLS